MCIHKSGSGSQPLLLIRLDHGFGKLNTEFAQGMQYWYVLHFRPPGLGLKENIVQDVSISLCFFYDCFSLCCGSGSGYVGKF
jgi:hypothetical protein